MPNSNVACDTCGANDFKVVYPSTLKRSLADSNFTVLGELGEYPQIVTCNNCGLIYANPRDNAADLVEKYRELSVNEYLREQESRREITAKDASIVEKFINGGRFLDIGCSAGLFLASLSKEFSATGIEPSINASAEARKNAPSATIFNSTLGEAPLHPNTFDAVSMWDVIEHLESPSEALKDVNKLLVDGGLLFLVTPDIGSLFARALGRRWPHLIRGHIYYFTRKTMQAALEQRGFKVEFISSYKRFFRLHYILRRVGLLRSEYSWMKSVWPFSQRITLDQGDAMFVVARKISDISL